MKSDSMPSESDIVMVMEAHGLLPEGPLLDEALELASLYADLIQERLGELPVSVDRHKAILAILEEGLMQEGFIPNRQEKKFEMPIIEEGLMREGIILGRRQKKFDMPTARDNSDKQEG